jgi:TatD DNase family protein
MELVDTHCHLHEAVRRTTPVYDKWHEKGPIEPEAVLAAAKQDGVETIVCIGTTLEDSQLAVEFVAERAGLYASVGIHPHEAKNHRSAETKAAFSQLLSAPKVVAIGECGFDFYYTHSPKEDQIELLEFQLQQAQEHHLPLSFHVREAFEDFWPIFDRYPGLRGVLHSFTDNQTNLQMAIDRGLYIGVNGIATFAKSPEQLEMYKAIPLDRLLLETDSPFLTPSPYRGSINEPKRVKTVADFVADLRGENRENMSTATTSNAKTLFGI